MIHLAIVEITIRERVATVSAGIVLVCNNPTDTIHFNFDDEWAEHDAKTARFAFERTYIDVPFSGNEVRVPNIFHTNYVNIGVYTDNLTSTYAKIACRFSIKCLSGKNFAPSEDVYNQLLELINEMETGGVSDEEIAAALEAYLAENPIEGVKGEDGKDGTDGVDGVSPTVTISKSGTVTTLTIADANGTQTATINDGEPGATGAKGDKGDTGASVSPLFADSTAECTDQSKLYVLPDGYVYVYTEGGTQEVFTDVLAAVGYQENYRISSSGGFSAWDASASDITGYIPCATGDVIRVENMVIPSTYTSGAYWNRVAAYDANKTYLSQITLNTDFEGTAGLLVDAVAENGSIVQFTIKESVFGANVAYIVIDAQDITADSELYVNSTFVESSGWMNTGHAFVAANGSGSVPSYWLNELNSKVDTIQQAMEAAGRNKSAFLWYTDAHWPTNSGVSPALLDYLYRHTPMAKVNFGGDIVGDPTSFTRENIEYVYTWRQMISGLPNHHSIPGNHDLNHNTTDVRDMAYTFLIAPEESPYMVMGRGLYYYIDSPAEQTRYLYLDYLTSDHEAMVTQGEFIAEAIMGVQDGWHIVVIGHRWFQYTSSSAPTVGSVPTYEADILSVLDAYNAKTSRAESNYFAAQDFSAAPGKVEFCVGGHIHVDYDFATDGGIPIILTASDTNQERSGADDEDCGTLGTITESAVYGIIADYANSMITVVGIGRGTSRIIAL